MAGNATSVFRTFVRLIACVLPRAAVVIVIAGRGRGCYSRGAVFICVRAEEHAKETQKDCPNVNIGKQLVSATSNIPEDLIVTYQASGRCGSQAYPRR